MFPSSTLLGKQWWEVTKRNRQFKAGLNVKQAFLVGDLLHQGKFTVGGEDVETLRWGGAKQLAHKLAIGNLREMGVYMVVLVGRWKRIGKKFYFVREKGTEEWRVTQRKQQ